MSCCAPGAEIPFEKTVNSEELWLASRDLGNGRRMLDLSVPAVHCGACISTIERALTRRPEVERARVNLSTKRVGITFQDRVGDLRTDPADFVDAIGRVGYKAHLFQEAPEQNDALRNQLLVAVAVAGFAATNIMLLSVSVWSGAEAATRDMFHWISAMIATPALIYSGRFFFASAWTVLRRGHTNMDVPISLAVSLSYGVSLWETIHHGEHVWFDATTSLLFFLLIGRTLDHIMRDRARSAVLGLARLSPRGALVFDADGGRDYRSVEDIRSGDRILVSAGERVAIDSIVVSGESDIDLSIVNGESQPVRVRPGDRVLAGTVNLTGSLTVEAAADARNSFLAEIVSLMEAAEGGKARYRRVADRAAQLYSPLVHLLALITFLGWGFYDGDWKHALLVAVAVLVITCPCALGLAVPVVQVIAAGRLFRNGVMVKDGSAMERLAEATHAVFDKTGTLTMGRPRLVNSEAVDAAALATAAGLAHHSRHPLSLALAAACRSPSAEFETVREVAGGGLEGRDARGVWRLGSRAYALGGASGRNTADQSEVVLSRDYTCVATFLFEDTLRPGAASTVKTLFDRGMQSSLLSGDREGVVRKLAACLGIADWRGALDPMAKTQAVRAMTAAGGKVLMVGDGINDAPALRSAHVSMAPSTAADIGRQAADFVFMREGLDAVTLALDISRGAGRLIRQNFALAIGYNVVAVPVAILGYATPLIAAIAMSSSSVIVVANSLRLNASRSTANTVGLTDQHAVVEAAFT